MNFIFFNQGSFDLSPELDISQKDIEECLELEVWIFLSSLSETSKFFYFDNLVMCCVFSFHKQKKSEKMRRNQ